MQDPLLAPMAGAEHHEVGGVAVDILPAGRGRIKRVIYPAGYRWSTYLKPLLGTELCMHAHVGFLARGQMQGEYADGCTFELSAPQAVVVAPGHDAWVIGEEPAVFFEVDFAGETAASFGLAEHSH